MKVIIVGAGDVGYVAAETICTVHDVLIIEKDGDVAETVKSRLNVSVLHEDGTNPVILSHAIEMHHAEIIISTLHRDDSNLFICLMAKRFNPEIRTIASITNPDYMIGTTDEGFVGVDVIVSPEIITAQKMYYLAIVENLVDFEYMGSDLELCLAIFSVESHNKINGQIVMNIDTQGEFTIFGIYRDENLLLSVDTMEIHPGDRICVVGSRDGIFRFNEIVGVDDVSREFVILGGSIVGRNLARLLSQDSKKRSVKIIDRNPEQCRELSKALTGVVVINSDFTEPDVQMMENVFKADCTISTSRLDDTNLLMCMSAQKFNARKVISRYFKKEYEDIFKFTGLECIIGYDKIVSNEITKCTISNDMVILRMRSHNEVFFNHTVDKDSKLLNRYYGDLHIPEGIRIVAIIREDGNETVKIYPRMDTRICEGDRIVVFTNLTKESDLARVFGKNVAVEL